MTWKEHLEEGQCAKCKKFNMKFRDELSVRTYELHGLCQRCQDEIFEVEDE